MCLWLLCVAAILRLEVCRFRADFQHMSTCFDDIIKCNDEN